MLLDNTQHYEIEVITVRNIKKTIFRNFPYFGRTFSLYISVMS